MLVLNLERKTQIKQFNNFCTVPDLRKIIKDFMKTTFLLTPYKEANAYLHSHNKYISY